MSSTTALEDRRYSEAQADREAHLLEQAKGKAHKTKVKPTPGRLTWTRVGCALYPSYREGGPR